MSHSLLTEQTASPETPGTKFFPPFEVTPGLEAEAAASLAHYPASKRSAMLPLLHLVQQKFGFISAPAIRWVAEKLDLELIQVLEVVSFYPGFRQSAPGKFHIRVCRTLSCAMGGSYELMARLCELTGIDRAQCDAHHHPIAVSPCGTFSVEFAECLASCGTAPVCMVNDDFHEGVTADQAAALLQQKFPDFRVAMDAGCF
ncbi:MAG: NAD(P)H-dependent oxidoreductase subunit E [Verrucomicrobia bacterium]|nr:NAD(P)H-dependent oxidoreductase subunit E [Verrucomicrobiota bacterium]